VRISAKVCISAKVRISVHQCKRKVHISESAHKCKSVLLTHRNAAKTNKGKYTFTLMCTFALMHTFDTSAHFCTDAHFYTDAH
jgi:hypothetical protein